MRLIQLLVADLHSPALTALILQECEDTGSDDTKHEDIAYGVVSQRRPSSINPRETHRLRS